MLRKLLILGFVVITLVASYAVTPLIAAWQIREAVRTGDTATLARKVDWVAVRQSLKGSLAETRKALTELAEAAGEPKPSLWQRVKSAALPYFADPLIERYVTADGAPRLYAWRQSWRQRMRPALGMQPAKGALAGTWLGGTPIDRGLSLARRIERAAFVSPTRVEIELADTYATGRSWFAALELRGFDWQLVEMKVLSRPATSVGADKARIARSE